jgi:CelD/BcsL family acetyltransferase involved in cellulose biosynthesis
MQVIEIDTAAALERLRPQWKSLWERTPGAGPFQHPDWLLAWWRHIGGGDLLAVLISDAGELVGIAPFYIYSDPAEHVRQLTLLGNGISDSCDVLLDPRSPGAADALGRRLGAHTKDWSCYDLRDLPPSSRLIPLCNELGARIGEDSSCVVVDLSRWRDGDSCALRSNFLADLRRRQRRAEELGRVRIELTDGARVADGLRGLFDLHAARWRALGEGGVLCDVEAFHNEIAERFSRRGWLRLYRLYVGDRLIAVNYGFTLRGRAYSYIGGFDPGLAHLGAGGILLYRAIRDAAEEGADDFDFLRGEEQYKLRWGGKGRPQYRIRSPLCSREEGRPCLVNA